MRTTSLLSVAVLLAVAGCAPEAEPVGAEPVGAAQAEPVGNQISASATESAKKYSPTGLAFGGESCTEVYEGDATDIDGDGIRDNLNSVTASCTGADGGTANASFSIIDDFVESVNPALYPWNLTVNGHFDIAGNDGAGTSVSTAADQTVSVHSDATSFGGSDAASVAVEITAPNASFTADESYDWDSTYTQSQDPGALFGDGLMSLAGAWSVEMEAHQGEDSARVYADATVSADAPGLTLDDACDTHITGGVLRATYDAGAAENDESATVTAELTVTFSACNSWVTTYSETVNPTPGS